MYGKLALHYVERQHLPPIRPNTPAQLIVRIEADPVFRDRVLFHTPDTVWSFGLQEMVAFPRRGTYGEIRDWRELPAPTADELCFGDILPPYAGKSHQVVVIVIPHKGDLVWRIECWEPDVSITQIYHVHRFETLSFPRQRSDYRLRAPSPQDGTTRVHGPYVHVPTGKFLLLAVHPWGHGRWPEIFPPVEKALSDKNDIQICRPPEINRPDQWADLDFLPEKWDNVTELPTNYVLEQIRHPYDLARRNTIL